MQSNNPLALLALCPVLGGLACHFVPTAAHAEVLDFESGFVDLQPVGTVKTLTNTVTFEVGDGTPGGTAFVAQAGDPMTAFGTGADPLLENDTPHGGASEYSLSDGDTSNSPSLDYFISFVRPVVSLSLDLYDLRTPEGDVVVGDTATLTGFSDVLLT